MSQKFIIVRCSDGEPHSLVPFTDPDAAAKEAKKLQYWSGHKYKIQAISDEDGKKWRKREADRFKSGDYTAVPWHKCRWVAKCKDAVDHFVHVAVKDPSKIAFTENAQKGELDRQTQISPGKYLQRYYGKIISQRTLQKWVAAYRKQYGADYELKFAYTGDEMVEVYRHCSSCMTGTDTVRAYEGPDLAVAYIERKDKITARGVVWPKKKWYNTIYGDADLLQSELDALGYKFQGNFAGARLKRIPRSGPVPHYIKKEHWVILPSLDISRRGVDYDHKKYIVLT